MANQKINTTTSQTVSDQTLDQIVDRLVSLASPVKIILFGSHARREDRPGSDLDLLVVEREVTDRNEASPTDTSDPDP